MDSARSQTDQQLSAIRREMSSDYDSLAESMSAHLSEYLSEHTDDSGLVTEDAFLGGGWERMRDRLAREAVDANGSAMESLGRSLDDVRSLTSQGSPSASAMPHPSVDVARDLAWNRRQVESAARHAVGRTPAQGGQYMRTVADRNLNGAVRTARTSINGAENAGRMDAMLARGGSKRWLTVQDERVRDSHAALHGMVIPVGERFPNGLMFPCDPDGDPSEVCNCRCMIEWVDTADTPSDRGTMTEQQVDKALDELSGVNFLGNPVESSPDNPSRLAKNPIPYVGYDRTQEIMEAYDRAKKDGDPRILEQVEVDKLLSTQAGIYRQNAHDILHSGLEEFTSPIGEVDYIELFEIDGHLYVIDGNHRAAIAKLRGDRLITAMVRRARR